ncbi:MAG: 3-phosphoglycerate dehydrogenase [Ignavibacteriae bacterium]|nr:MAG: 3-phosphoglycerate dehydrogenase [Ignavibacteriota bacterium]
MVKILANDGIESSAKEMLAAHGYEVVTEKVPQEELVKEINDKKYDAILVRSATKVRKDLIDACPSIKLIGRGGVGMDNIDVEYARGKGINVVNTPAASSQSVAELAFAHLFTLTRMLHDSNRFMPSEGSKNFPQLKKKYSKGIEVSGKTLGIVGFGRIGQKAAKMALGLGMKVLATDPVIPEATVDLEIFHSVDQTMKVSVVIKTVPLAEVIKNSDFITFHIPMPKDKKPVISAKEIAMMKDGVFLINSARGGIIDEKDLVEGLKSGKIAFAGMDVYMDEPTPNTELLMLPNVSLTPHVGGQTVEAQNRIGIELAEKIISHFNNN